MNKSLNKTVLASGSPGILRNINYKNKTASVEMDNKYLVEYPWSEIFVKEGGQG